MPAFLLLLIFSFGPGTDVWQETSYTVFPESSQVVSPSNEQLDNSPTNTYPIFARNNSNKK